MTVRNAFPKELSQSRPWNNCSELTLCPAEQNAKRVWEEGADFMAKLKGDAEVMAALCAAEIEETFDPGYHRKTVDVIFARIFGG